MSLQSNTVTALLSLTFWDQEGQLHLLLQILVRDALSIVIPVCCPWRRLAVQSRGSLQY